MLSRLAPAMVRRAHAAAVHPCVEEEERWSEGCAARRAKRHNAGRAGAALSSPTRALSLSPPAHTHTHTHSVSITLVTPDGARHALRALPGTSLVDALLEADLEAAEGAVALSPAGRGAAEAVVSLPSEVAALVPPPSGDDAAALAELAVEVRPNTRLASAVTLGPEMEGAVLALGKLRPWKTL